jgi:hypothetical protein
MDTPSPSMRDLARRLLALEAASQSSTDAPAHEAMRVSEKLRTALTRFAGTDGFAALMRRALALARADVPALQTVKVTADGRLDGFEGGGSPAENFTIEAATAITAHLLGLLATFIGEPLTLRLVREAWPDAAWEEQL